MEGAYNPYSGFFVGAALLTIDGTIVTASNFENAAYSPGICAERAALVRANAEGHRRFCAIAVIARGSDTETREVTALCGVCRQMFYEASQVSGIDIEVILTTTNQERTVLTTIGELLPLAFGPKDLGIDPTRISPKGFID
jgi:cytidine deaminase